MSRKILSRRLFEKFTEGFRDAEVEIKLLNHLKRSTILPIIQQYERQMIQYSYIPIMLNVLDGTDDVKEKIILEEKLKSLKGKIIELEQITIQKWTPEQKKQYEEHANEYKKYWKVYAKMRDEVKSKVTEKLTEINPFFAYLYQNDLAKITELQDRISSSISRMFRRSIADKRIMVNDPEVEKFVHRSRGALSSALSSIRFYSDSVSISQPDTLDIIQRGIGFTNFLSDQMASNRLEFSEFRKALSSLFGILDVTENVLNQIKHATKGKLIKYEWQYGDISFEEDSDQGAIEAGMDAQPLLNAPSDAQDLFASLEDLDSSFDDLAEKFEPEEEEGEERQYFYKSYSLASIPHKERRKFWKELYRKLREKLQPDSVIGLFKVDGGLLDDWLRGKSVIPDQYLSMMMEVGEGIGFEVEEFFKEYLKSDEEQGIKKQVMDIESEQSKIVEDEESKHPQKVGKGKKTKRTRGGA
jgi:hypothetical protein